VKITRRLFINRRNGQGSITLPKKVLEKLQEDMKISKYPKKIKLEIISPKEAVANKFG